MKLLKNRKIAILITVILAVAASVFGVGRSLNRLARDIEVMFYDGVYLDDAMYTQPGIEAHLKNRLNSALAFAAMMEDFPEAKNETETLLSARNTLISANDISEKYDANRALDSAYWFLYEKANSLELTKRDEDDIAQFTSTFAGAQNAINDSLYNQKALSFMDNASFFAKILKPFAFVTPPQIFAE